MADQSVQVTYSEEFDSLVEILSKVDKPGDYYAAGTLEMPMPSLSIEGVGLLSFPVPAAQARELIAKAAERAPYGRGEQTLVDESVRKVWQIPPQKIKLSGKGWSTHFDSMVEQVARELGCHGVTVSAEFYKLLVYDEDGFFLSHRDSEKTGGMFGTLVVVLPSAHEGGKLHIRHGSREVELDLSGTEAAEVRYAAFYADCEHEVRPITQGYRVCLIYNLIQKPGAKPVVLSTPDDRQAVAACARELEEWTKRDDAPEKIVYLLEHHYTQAALSLASLKNGDAARALVLRKAAEQSGCAFHLGLVHIEEFGSAEYSGGWDDDDDEENYEVYEVCDGSWFIDQWRNGRDEPMDFGEIPLGVDELLPPGALDDEEPDESHFSEATGNEGGSFERTYLRAALVLWPQSDFDAICVSAGTKPALARFGQLVDEGALEAARRFARLIISHWRAGRDVSDLLSLFLRHAVRSGDADLIEDIARSLLPEYYDGGQNEALAESSRVLGPERSATRFQELFSRHGKLRPTSCLGLWLRLAQETAHQPEFGRMLELTATTVLGHFPACRRESPLPEPGSDSYELPKPVAMAPELVVDLLGTLHRLGLSALAFKAVWGMSENTEVFCPEATLVPALEKMKAGARPSDPLVFMRLWGHASAYFRARTKQPPAPPQDWSQPATIGCKCADCRMLQDFIRDPVPQTFCFAVRKDRRQHLHEQIERASLDMTHVTERKGKPQTLVCSKTRATYDRACERYKLDLNLIRRLNAMA